MANTNCIYLGFKLNPGPIERFKVENFDLNNSIGKLRSVAEMRSSIPSKSLVLVHHGKILNDSATLHDCGIKHGEMVHVVKKKTQPPPEPPQNFTDSELQQIITALRTFGCTPNAPGWTRAMQVLNNEESLSEITDTVPSLNDECVTLSILHEVELLAALGANVHTMRRAATARPDLPVALHHLTRLVRSTLGNNSTNSDAAPTSGFAYSLEALSEDDDGDEEEGEEASGGAAITQEQLAAALLAARGSTGSSDGLPGSTASTSGLSNAADGGSRSLITQEMFSDAISRAMNNITSSAGTPAEQAMDVAGSSSQHNIVTAEEGATSLATPPAPVAVAAPDPDSYMRQVAHMREMGLTDDAMNLRALLICDNDVNSAINLILSGHMTDE